MKTIEGSSIGTDERFGRQGAAQIAALRKAREKGVDVAMVWNKSNREHLLTDTEPADQRVATELAIQETGWDGPWHVNADHIGLATVDRFATYCDFFTLDVANFIVKTASPEAIEAFAAKHANLSTAKGIPVRLDAVAIKAAAGRYLYAVNEASKNYCCICTLRNGNDFVTELSMDETAIPQSPAELIVILAALVDAGIPVQTLAPSSRVVSTRASIMSAILLPSSKSLTRTFASPSVAPRPLVCRRASISRSTPETISSAATKASGISSAKRAQIFTSRLPARPGLNSSSASQI